jgi:hypothetical protein
MIFKSLVNRLPACISRQYRETSDWLRLQKMLITRNGCHCCSQTKEHSAHSRCSPSSASAATNAFTSAIARAGTKNNSALLDRDFESDCLGSFILKNGPAMRSLLLAVGGFCGLASALSSCERRFLRRNAYRAGSGRTLTESIKFR